MPNWIAINSFTYGERTHESADPNEASPLTNLQSAPSWPLHEGEKELKPEESKYLPKFPHFLSARGCRFHDLELYNFHP